MAAVTLAGVTHSPIHDLPGLPMSEPLVAQGSASLAAGVKKQGNVKPASLRLRFRHGHLHL
jgi:hypothetical protein